MIAGGKPGMVTNSCPLPWHNARGRYVELQHTLIWMVQWLNPGRHTRRFPGKALRDVSLSGMLGSGRFGWEVVHHPVEIDCPGSQMPQILMGDQGVEKETQAPVGILFNQNIS